jgi:hypothetical protein
MAVDVISTSLFVAVTSGSGIVVSLEAYGLRKIERLLDLPEQSDCCQQLTKKKSGDIGMLFEMERPRPRSPFDFAALRSG